MKLERILDLMKKNLKDFPIFNESQIIDGKFLDNGKLWVSYKVNKEIRTGTTKFDINIIGDTCYILWIELDKKHRGKNLGKSLYKVIENFSKDYGCKKIRLTPSGKTPSGKTRLEYMKSLGYKEIGSEVEKILN